MTNLGNVVRNLRKKARGLYLQAGEVGWGIPAPRSPMIRSSGLGNGFKVGVIGAGLQGLAQCRALSSIKGIEIAGLADIDPSRLKSTADLIGLPESRRFSDAEEMLRKTGPLDLASVATTAPSHVEIGRIALKCGARRVLLEKPMDNSLNRARAFTRECEAMKVPLAVNYSRRWMLDYLAIRRCISKGYIGNPRSVSVIVGRGELAMLGSHYFDLCRFIFDSEPTWVISHLNPITDVNPRGAFFQDPSGFCLFGFRNGARAFIDFSFDLKVKDPILTIKGDAGRIMVDEGQQSWTLQSRGHRVWHYPFAEPMKAATLFTRVVTDVLSDHPTVAGGDDGIADLEMIVGAHLSDRRDHQMVTFPLSEDESSREFAFP
jgi:predicted dehydrogenase